MYNDWVFRRPNPQEAPLLRDLHWRVLSLSEAMDMKDALDKYLSAYTPKQIRAIHTRELVEEETAESFRYRLRMLALQAKFRYKSFHSKDRLAKPLNREGNVYLMKSGTSYKIGRSGDVSFRRSSIQCCCPEALEIVHYRTVLNCVALENSLHKIFKTKRIQGEWFKFNTQDVKKVIKILNRASRFCEQKKYVSQPT